MRKRISRFSVFQTSGVTALTYFFVSLIIYVIATIVALAQGGGAQSLWLLLAPIPVAVGVYIAYLIILPIYNMVARWVGGFEFDLVDSDKEEH